MHWCWFNVFLCNTDCWSMVKKWAQMQYYIQIFLIYFFWEVFLLSVWLFIYLFIILNLQNGVDSMSRSMEKPRTLDDVNDKMKPWQLAEIVDPVQCRMVTMPESTDAGNKVGRLINCCLHCMCCL